MVYVLMMSNEEKSLQEVLGPVTRVLKDLKGQLTFRDEDGVEFVLMGREYLEELRGAKEQIKEAQLSFEAVRTEVNPGAEGEVEEEAQEADRPVFEEEAKYDDLALLDESEYPEEVEAMKEEERDDEEASEMVFTSNRNQPQPPPVRVRFEPFGGELPPQLQE